MIAVIIVLLAFFLLFGTKKGRGLISRFFKWLSGKALKAVIYVLLTAGLIFLMVKLVMWIIDNPGTFFLVFFISIGAIVVYSVISSIIGSGILKSKVDEWLQMIPQRQFTDFDISELVEPFANNIAAADTNERKITGDLPFGRITYFLNFFGHDLEDEEPLFFSPKPSLDKDELREYGTAVTSAGIYISAQYGKPNKEGHYNVEEKHIPFSGAVYYKLTDSSITVYYPKLKDKVYLSQTYTTVPVGQIAEMLKAVIMSGVSRAIYEENVYSLTAMLDEREEQKFIAMAAEEAEITSQHARSAGAPEQPARAPIQPAETPGQSNAPAYDPGHASAVAEQTRRDFEARKKAQGYAKGYEAAGVAAAIPNMNRVYDQTKLNVNQIHGHGPAAEYANNTIDRFRGINAQHLGADNAPNGADRMIISRSGEVTLLQSKYCETPSRIIYEGFLDPQHSYSKDMIIEVPRDKYDGCVKTLADRIREGKLKDKGLYAENEQEARELAIKHLKKGNITYQQALNVATAGTVDSIKIDAMQGIMCSSVSGSITALITFATCKWHGVDTKDAALMSLKVGAKTIGKATAIYVVTMQLSRKNVINVFSSAAKSDASHTVKMGGNFFATADNPIFKVSDNLAKKITKSSFAKSGLGKAMKLDTMRSGELAQKMMGSSVTVAITFGPDICRALVGRISFKQLLKNSIVAGAGLAGGVAAGAAAGSVVPVVGNVIGAMVGGAVAGAAAKKVTDRFIEDDAVEMFIILKEEFMDVVPMSGLSQEEFNEVVSVTIAHVKLDRLLQDMYKQSKRGRAREYARDELISKAVQNVLRKREVITEAQFDDAFSQLALEA